jgi:hypothetical protein
MRFPTLRVFSRPVTLSLSLTATLALGTVLLAGMSQARAQAEAAPGNVPPPTALRVNGPLPPAPEGVAELKFKDMFVMPVGPRGLQPSAKLMGLRGQRVRMVGFVANAEEATPGMLVLTPIPVTLGDEDEKLVDDLPPTAVFVHLHPRFAQARTPNFVGLIQLTGTLELGAHEEADGHTSTTRLVLDEAQSQSLVDAAQPVRTAAH